MSERLLRSDRPVSPQRRPGPGSHSPLMPDPKSGAMRGSRPRRGPFGILMLLVCLLAAACGPQPAAGSSPVDPGAVAAVNPTVLAAAGPTVTPTAVPTPAAESAPAESVPSAETPSPAPTAPSTTVGQVGAGENGCALGIGLRQETAAVVLAHRDDLQLVMSASSSLSALHFPKLDGVTRLLGAPSLDALEQKAERALADGVPYEGLAYGLETSPTTPDSEWGDLVGSAEAAQAIADRFDKSLVIGPGFRLMARHEDAYPAMASSSDLWMLQTQQLQKGPPGEDYREEVARIAQLIRSGNPDIRLWAQITFPPDREPDADEWLAYRASIADLVDGTFIGIYTWDTLETNELIAAIEAILAVCESED